jgi:uncharacterized membrane protein YhaH (DUF805 family)
MNFGQAVKSGFSHYVTFSGRAVRSEYWYWVLFCSVGSLATIILDIAILGYDNVSPFTDIFNLVLLLPSIAVGARRLHDIDRTAWWLLLWLTGVGFILLVVWFCFRGTPGPNRFGPDPFSTSR